MSIEVNELTFPDIPEDLPEQYPFVAIFEVTSSSTTTTAYMLYATPGSLLHFIDIAYYGFVEGYTCYWLDSSNNWTLMETNASESAMLDAELYTPLATNYSIFRISEDDSDPNYGTIIFKRNIWPESFDTIEPPSIPQDFIYSYPYTATLRVNIESAYLAFGGSNPDDTLIYGAAMTTGPIYYADVEDMQGLVSLDSGHLGYVLDIESMTWIDASESDDEFITAISQPLISMEAIPLWSNHNIETVTGVDDNGDLIFSDTYFEATETVTPIDYYTVSRLQLLATAQQARRHNDFSTAPLTIEEMALILSNVSILDDVSEVAF